LAFASTQYQYPQWSNVIPPPNFGFRPTDTSSQPPGIWAFPSPLPNATIPGQQPAPAAAPAAAPDAAPAAVPTTMAPPPPPPPPPTSEDGAEVQRLRDEILALKQRLIQKCTEVITMSKRAEDSTRQLLELQQQQRSRASSSGGTPYDYYAPEQHDTFETGDVYSVQDEGVSVEPQQEATERDGRQRTPPPSSHGQNYSRYRPNFRAAQNHDDTAHKHGPPLGGYGVYRSQPGPSARQQRDPRKSARSGFKIRARRIADAVYRSGEGTYEKVNEQVIAAIKNNGLNLPVPDEEFDFRRFLRS